MSRRPEKREKEKKQIKYFDYTLLFIIIFLVGFGLVMLYSTSSYNAQVKFGNSAFYLRKQLLASLIGFGGMFIVAHVDYHIWTRLSGLAYIAALGLCTLVIFAGAEYNGSSRWLRVGGISFQPSELAKFAVIIFLATIISKIPKQIGSLMTVFKILAIVLPIVVVVAVNNLSTAIIILGIAVCLLFVASPKYGQFLAMGGLVIGVGAVFIMVESYRAERLRIWLHPEDYEKGYQTLQGLYAIGSGGLFGKGLGESMQKLGFLPEAQNDMIFSIICEELGLFGAICVILLFLLLIWRFLVIANNAPDLFGALIVVGIMAHIAIQVILNIAVVTNTIPNTGITLPFISYGGTSVAILLTEMGLALSVSRRIKLEMV
ncbi:cell division protein FtsW [Roseburia sp. BX1005]|uniref:Probable peptidoglycan glycosyltransferase FtsW n=1 Tax=Roseburia zhanii TaxID=2763064 RepID=A0A923LN40_9FIRM|nr:putative peptidoglycan glycosyltransferase FtsW [Roseburia zhanii]MBC5713337.1 cell division protein FtsW [Roseburia zhanii]